MQTCNVCTNNLFYISFYEHDTRTVDSLVWGLLRLAPIITCTYHTKSTKKYTYIHAYLVWWHLMSTYLYKIHALVTYKHPSNQNAWSYKHCNKCNTAIHVKHKLYSIHHYIDYKDDINGSSSYAAVSLQQSATGVLYIRVFQ